MTNNVIQPSFAAGELSPTLDARVDIAKYKVGAARVRNFYVDYRGGVTTRPGTRWIMEAASSLAGNPFQNVRMIEFEFNTEQTYVLVFTHMQMQVIKSGAVVGAPYTLTTPYDEQDLPTLKFFQSADVMTLTHPSYPPANLSRLADDNWELTTVTFSTSQNAPTSVTAVAAVAGGTTDYNYVVTSVDSETAEESIASAVGSVTNAAIMSSNGNESVTVSWTAAADANLYNVYRQVEVPNGTAAAGQLFGFVGSSTTTSFVDRNSLPNYTITPPLHYDPFTSYGYPSCGSYFAQRKWFAASANYPQSFWATQVGNFDNMDKSIPTRDSDALTGTIASTKVNSIRHALAMPSGLIMLTSGAIWQVSGGQPGAAVTPATVQANQQAFNGASHVPPLQINQDILYVQDMGSTVRDLSYNFYANIYTGTDMSVLAAHLFTGKTIVDWAWAEEPYKIIWTVRNDGVLLGFTYLKEQDIYAWSRHDTQGNFIDVCSVNEGTRDAVYVAVRRFIGCGVQTSSIILRQDTATDDVSYLTRQDGSLYLRQDVGTSEGGRWAVYIERMDDATYPNDAQIGIYADVEQAWCVDSGLAWPLVYPDAALQPGAETGDVVVFETDAAAFTEDMAGYIIRGGGGKAIIISVSSSTKVVAEITRPFSWLIPNDVCRMPQRIPSGQWTCTQPVSRVTGLDHLEGMEVVGMADGNVQPAATVVGGAYDLQAEADAIVVGLRYRPQLQTMRLDVGDPTIQGKRKLINSVTVRVANSRGIWVGDTFDDMIEYKQRDLEEMGEPIALYSGDQRLNINGGFDTEGQVCIEIRDPVPATILGVIPEVVIGDT